MRTVFFATLFALLFAPLLKAQTGTGNKVQKTIERGQQTVNKVKTMLAVFQPYLLKARELYGQGKQLLRDAKSTAKNVKNTGTGEGTTIADNTVPYTSNEIPVTATDTAYPAVSTPSYGIYDNYTPEQYLPINDEATINSDGTGNWGQQNNALYGNCLDVFTGTIMGLGEAEQTPGSVDILFIANLGTYTLATPNWIKNEVAGQYTSRPSYDAISRWRTVNETEVAETRMSLDQFDKITNNNQILNAVKNATNYQGYIHIFSKMEGKVFAVKVEQENRTVYALIAVEKHVGTTGSNGYLKIKVKSQGIDTNADGLADPGAYIR